MVTESRLWLPRVVVGVWRIRGLTANRCGIWGGFLGFDENVLKSIMVTVAQLCECPKSH